MLMHPMAGGASIFNALVEPGETCPAGAMEIYTGDKMRDVLQGMADTGLCGKWIRAQHIFFEGHPRTIAYVISLFISVAMLYHFAVVRRRRVARVMGHVGCILLSTKVLGQILASLSISIRMAQVEYNNDPDIQLAACADISELYSPFLILTELSTYGFALSILLFGQFLSKPKIRMFVVLLVCTSSGWFLRDFLSVPLDKTFIKVLSYMAYSLSVAAQLFSIFVIPRIAVYVWRALLVAPQEIKRAMHLKFRAREAFEAHEGVRLAEVDKTLKVA